MYYPQGVSDIKEFIVKRDSVNKKFTDAIKNLIIKISLTKALLYEALHLCAVGHSMMVVGIDLESIHKPSSRKLNYF